MLLDDKDTQNVPSKCPITKEQREMGAPEALFRKRGWHARTR